MDSTDLHRIINVRFLTEHTFVLRFDRCSMVFKPGQHIIVGLEGELNQREYSIYSGENDDYLEILVREVPEGNVSLKLKNCNPDDFLQVNGPFGTFGIEKFDLQTRKHIFIATGTGISPFHSMVRSYPEIDYTLIHGVRYGTEAYERDEYDPLRHILCTSKETNEGKKGRVTRYLSGFRVKSDMLFYLCGNSNMIYEVGHILQDKGVYAEDILTEVYF